MFESVELLKTLRMSQFSDVFIDYFPLLRT